MKTVVNNPWFRKDGPYSRPIYELEGIPVFEYRGVQVFKRTSSWMYILGNTAITERAGFTKANVPQIIDEILDGQTPSADLVVDHLRANGYKGLTYDEYQMEHNAGRMS